MFQQIDYLDQWKEGIKEGQYPWFNTIDKNGKTVEKIYYENGANRASINVLIDDQRKIIAWDVSGVELQYHIWKRLDNN